MKNVEYNRCLLDLLTYFTDKIYIAEESVCFLTIVNNSQSEEYLRLRIKNLVKINFEKWNVW